MEESIDNILLRILENMDNTPITRTVPSTRTYNQANPSLRYVNRQLDIVGDLINQYQTNMQEYQRNITLLITLIHTNNQLFRLRTQQTEQSPLRTTNLNRENPFFSYSFRNVNTQPQRQGSNTRPLTQREISTATRNFTYTTHVASTLNESRCPISLDNFQTGDLLTEIRGCGHVFRNDNLTNWLRRSVYCPLCRHNLRTPTRSDGSYNTTQPQASQSPLFSDNSANRMNSTSPMQSLRSPVISDNSTNRMNSTSPMQSLRSPVISDNSANNIYNTSTINTPNLSAVLNDDIDVIYGQIYTNSLNNDLSYNFDLSYNYDTSSNLFDTSFINNITNTLYQNYMSQNNSEVADSDDDNIPDNASVD